MTDFSKTTVLKDFAQFIDILNAAMVEKALIIHAFLLTCPRPNLSISFDIEDERFDLLKNECAEHIDKDYAKSINQIAIESNEVLYIFNRYHKQQP